MIPCDDADRNLGAAHCPAERVDEEQIADAQRDTDGAYPAEIRSYDHSGQVRNYDAHPADDAGNTYHHRCENTGGEDDYSSVRFYIDAVESGLSAVSGLLCSPGYLPLLTGS